MSIEKSRYASPDKPINHGGFSQFRAIFINLQKVRLSGCGCPATGFPWALTRSQGRESFPPAYKGNSTILVNGLLARSGTPPYPFPPGKLQNGTPMRTLRPRIAQVTCACGLPRISRMALPKEVGL